MACAKIECTKYMLNINDNAVQGHLSDLYRKKALREYVRDPEHLRGMIILCV